MPFIKTIIGAIVLMGLFVTYGALHDYKENIMSYKVIKFEADWCGPCQAMKPVWKELQSQIDDVEFVVVNVDDDPEMSSIYNVRSIPTIVFIKDDKPVSAIVGAVKLSVLLDEINKLKGVE